MANNIDDFTRAALERIAWMLPGRVFDAHVHVYPLAVKGPQEALDEGDLGECRTIDNFRLSAEGVYGGDELRALALPFVPPMNSGTTTRQWCDISNRFVAGQLAAHPDCVGEVFVAPWMSEEDIDSYFTHGRLRGIKCYHTASGRPDSYDADIREYLPESAWRYAHDRNLVITLHLVKDRALSDPENLGYIIEHARKYPSAKLILAHCARGFAQHTTTESLSHIARYDNIYFDSAAVCEPYVIFRIVRMFGARRLLWGSDYDISEMKGRSITLGETLHWVYEQDVPGHRCHRVLIESLTALAQAADMLGLSQEELDMIFYRNAADAACG